MKPQGKEFEGSSSLFETHQNLNPFAGNSIWLTQFQPKKQEHDTIELQKLLVVQFLR